MIVPNTIIHYDPIGFQLGAKKGFGGQRVKANFSEIEKEAMQKDKDREQLAENLAIQEAKTKEEQEKKM